jgi:hypothetical protein
MASSLAFLFVCHCAGDAIAAGRLGVPRHIVARHREMLLSGVRADPVNRSKAARCDLGGV